MEIVKNIMAFILFIFCFADLKGDYKSAIYDSYIGNKMVQWREVIDEMNAEKNKSNEFLMELINYQYAYTETGDFKMGKAYYDKILKIEPNFLWVKNELYPELLKMN